MATKKKSTSSSTKKQTNKEENLSAVTEEKLIEDATNAIKEEEVKVEVSPEAVNTSENVNEIKVDVVEEKEKKNETKNTASNYYKIEKKYRKMAEEAGITLPEYTYDENEKLVGSTLTGAEIVRQIIMGNIEIDGFDFKNLNPNSYNLTLGNVIKTYNPVHSSSNKNDRTQYLDIFKENPYNEYEFGDEGFALVPGKIYIATTNERTFTNKFIPKIDGRSSIGRLGIMVHLTAGYGDIGFNGKWTLEIAVIQPIIIYPNIPICQISFNTPSGDTSIQYKGRYQNQDSAQTSKFYLK